MTGGPSCEQLILLSVTAERFEMRHKHVEAFPDTPCLYRTYSYASHAADAESVVVASQIVGRDSSGRTFACTGSAARAVVVCCGVGTLAALLVWSVARQGERCILSIPFDLAEDVGGKRSQIGRAHV